MENELIDLCPICIDNPAEYYTECGHCYCIGCLSRIKKCAMCRNQLLRVKLCIQIQRNIINRTIESFIENNMYRNRMENNIPRILHYNVFRIIVGMEPLSYSN